MKKYRILRTLFCCLVLAGGVQGAEVMGGVSEERKTFDVHMDEMRRGNTGHGYPRTHPAYADMGADQKTSMFRLYQTLSQRDPGATGEPKKKTLSKIEEIMLSVLGDQDPDAKGKRAVRVAQDFMFRTYCNQPVHAYYFPESLLAILAGIKQNERLEVVTELLRFSFRSSPFTDDHGGPVHVSIPYDPSVPYGVIPDSWGQENARTWSAVYRTMVDLFVQLPEGERNSKTLRLILLAEDKFKKTKDVDALTEWGLVRDRLGAANPINLKDIQEIFKLSKGERAKKVVSDAKGAVKVVTDEIKDIPDVVAVLAVGGLPPRISGN